MKRRSFLRSTAAAMGIPCGLTATGSLGQTPAEHSLAEHSLAKHSLPNRLEKSFAVDANRVRCFTDAVSQTVRVLVAADTHLFTDDDRGKPYQQFSGRMAAAYNQTEHFETGQPTNPEESFVRILDRAQKDQVDLLALVGDIFSFPSEAAIEWVGQKLEAAKLPYLYVAGNHDWHYEGMPGSLEELRATWIERRLKPLYQRRDPLMSAYDVGEIRFLAIDNSHYQILPEQLEFFRAQVRSEKPLVLALHIPLFAPGRPMGFGCGHPEWGASTDRNYELERRPRWPEQGHTKVTLDFHREVFAAPNLLAVFAGHIHRNSIDVINGIPQFVTDDNASGAYIDVQFLPRSAV